LGFEWKVKHLGVKPRSVADVTTGELSARHSANVAFM